MDKTKTRENKHTSPPEEKDFYKLCPNCGNFSHIEENHMFCCVCGEKLIEACPGCGEKIINPLAKFCNNCGNNLIISNY